MQEIALAFTLDGKMATCERYGSGHINDTYLLITDTAHMYILQRVNHRVFQDVPALMQNISSVTRHLAKADSRPRHVLTLIPTVGGDPYHVDSKGNFWRVYDFITDSICLQKAESIEDFAQSAVAFGSFQNSLADFPADQLSETIPHFHDTPDRYRQLREAISKNKAGRLEKVKAEVDFALAHETEGGLLMGMLDRGELPLRVTHNDTKLNNVMLDATTRKALCVIDLDTVMPGLAANDFGDSIRFGASTAAEDEKDLSKVHFSLELYRAFAAGFLGECGKRLTKREIETLPLGAKLMTLECGIRFLADYLNGDVYFQIHHPQHNLDRCRTQFKLVADMTAQFSQMEDAIREICG